MKFSSKIKLDTYNCLVTFIVADNLYSVLKSIYSKYKINEEIDADAEGLVVTGDISNYYLIIDRQFITHNTLAHEIFHVAIKMTEARCIYDEESQAWVAGHLAGKIYKCLEKKGIEIKCE